jgi:hypothetical protein
VSAANKAKQHRAFQALDLATLGRCWRRCQRGIRVPNCNFYAIGNDYKEILEFVFSELACRVFQDYSEFDSELIEFGSADEVCEHYNLFKFDNGKSQMANIILWPTEASDKFKVTKIELNPDKCNGATYRYQANDWGLIQLQFKGTNKLGLQYSHTNHNTEKRALAWEEIDRDKLGNVRDWNFSVTTSVSRKIINFIKKHSNKKVGPMPVMACASEVELADANAV